MGPQEAQSWVDIITGPLGGALAGGACLGAIIGIYLWERYVVTPKVAQHIENCEAKIAAVEAELAIHKAQLDEYKPVVDRWTQLMQKTAFKEWGVDG